MSSVEEAVETKPYAMPQVRCGQIVNFFVLTRGPAALPIPCVVFEADHETLWLKSLGDKASYQSVRYISDPRLTNPAQKENGAWDFTPDYKELQTDRKLLSEKVRGLETRLSRLESNRK